MTTTEIAVREEMAAEMTVAELVGRQELIHEAMGSAMKSGIHFGTVRGVSKPTLLKPGAEMLNVMFRLAPEYDSSPTWHDDGHLTVISRCTLTHAPTGMLIASGEGLCTSREKKYAKRRDGSDNKELADTYNTVLKMAGKRALVAATLNATGASALFTQDMEDEPAPTAPESIDYGAVYVANAPQGGWPEIGTRLQAIDQQAPWGDWIEQAAAVVVGDPVDDWRKLEAAPGKRLGITVANAVATLEDVLHARETGSFDFPPPTRAEVQRAFAAVLGGAILDGPDPLTFPMDADEGAAALAASAATDEPVDDTPAEDVDERVAPASAATQGNTPPEDIPFGEAKGHTGTGAPDE